MLDFNFYGLNHSHTLAVVLPTMLKVRQQEKHEKLLQYAERVWAIKEGSEEQKIDAAIDMTRKFFELYRLNKKGRLL